MHAAMTWYRPIVALAFLFVGCTRAMTSTDGPCPAYVVAADAGTDAFSGVGDYKLDKVCESFCDKDHPVCQLVDDNHVKCQMGCE